MAAWKETGLVLLLLWCSGTTGEISPGQCHCATSSACSGYPDGTCDACEEFWSGPNCQIGNIARSDVHSTRLSEGSSDPDMVVDGEAKNLVHKCTSISDESGVLASWSVILNEKHDIYRMKIYHYTGNADDSFATFEVKVGGELCTKWSGTEIPPHELDITCDRVLSGDLVSISIPIHADYVKTLALCEVEIFECGDFWYGDNCDNRCNCADNSEICNKRDGTCNSETRETSPSPVPHSEARETTQTPPHSTSTVGTENPSTHPGKQLPHHGSVSIGEIAGVIAGIIVLLTVAVIAVILVIKMKFVKRPKVTDQPDPFHPVGPVVYFNGSYDSYPGQGQTGITQDPVAWPQNKVVLPPIQQGRQLE